jgi:nicotinamidase-related amidase
VDRFEQPARPANLPNREDAPVMLIKRDRCVLLVVDVQERLLPAIHDGASVLENCLWLTRLAQRLGVPVVASEQYPEGLGRSVTALREQLPPEAFVAKVHFSCLADGCLQPLPIYPRQQWIVAGTESHVCVLQTVLDLRAAGKEVFVVADAVGSRDPMSKELALARMRQHGVQIVSREMVAFEWLERAATEDFRLINREFIR